MKCEKVIANMVIARYHIFSITKDTLDCNQQYYVMAQKMT